MKTTQFKVEYLYGGKLGKEKLSPQRFVTLNIFLFKTDISIFVKSNKTLFKTRQKDKYEPSAHPDFSYF